MTTHQYPLPILILTVSLALAQPKVGKIKIGPATAAVLGAILTIITGALPPESLYRALSVLSYPVVAIISLMVLTLIADQAGLFELLAHSIARVAKGDGRKLFTYIFIAGTVTGAVFTNDAAVLIFTPLVYELIEEVKEESWGPSSKIPYYFAVLYVANLVGAFTISNPINIIVASFFNVSFLEYAKWMVFPAVVSMVSSYWGLRIFFNSSIPVRFRFANVPRAPKSRGFMALSGIVLFFTLLGFFVGNFIGVATWAIALTGALTLLVLSGLVEGADNLQIVKGIGWDVIIFVIGIFIVVSGLRNAGLTNQIETFLVYLAGSSFFTLTMMNGFVATICSSVMNNHPTAYAMALAIEDLPLHYAPAVEMFTRKMLVFSSLIGGDLGPKMLPIGSLAALLWFRILKNKGVHIPYSLYIKIGIPVTLAAVFLSVLALNLEIAAARFFSFPP